MTIPKRVKERIKAGLRRFRKVLEAARRADRSEQDTVTIVTDMLAEVLGYDKYTEVTGEYQIRGTYCDIAVKIEGKVVYLIEVKAIDKELRNSHLRQSCDYAAKEGIEWVVLTNGIEWHVHRMLFEKPVSSEEAFVMNVLEGDAEELEEQAFVLSREGMVRRSLDEYHETCQATGRHIVAAAVLSGVGLSMLRRELRRVFPGVRVDTEDIRRVLIGEVFKRDVVDSDDFERARRRVKRSGKRKLRKSGVEPKGPQPLRNPGNGADMDGAEQPAT